MFVVFGKGKCPMCGNKGKRLDKDIFKCADCEVSFNDYSLHGQPQTEKEKFWN